MQSPGTSVFSRREIVRLGVAATLAAWLGASRRASTAAKVPVGLQLFSVRADCARDLAATLAAVTKLGYAGVEFAGYHERGAAEADPEIVEEWKWETPVWSRGGIICTGEAYKKVVKLTFPKGASLEDPTGLFNSSLDGNVRRAIDLGQNGNIDEGALKDLIRAAVALNLKKSPRRHGRG